LKLLHCFECNDVVRLYEQPRACHCGKSVGRYNSDAYVILTGPCRAVGIDTGEWYQRGRGSWHLSTRVQRTDPATAPRVCIEWGRPMDGRPLVFLHETCAPALRARKQGAEVWY
jgi:hypothetical protein